VRAARRTAPGLPAPLSSQTAEVQSIGSGTSGSFTSSSQLHTSASNPASLSLTHHSPSTPTITTPDTMAAPNASTVPLDTPITIKISVNDGLKKIKLPLRDLGAKSLPDKVCYIITSTGTSTRQREDEDGMIVDC